METRNDLFELIARMAHEVNRAWCVANGDDSQKPWEEAEAWQRQSAMMGVEFVFNNPFAPASANHESWMEEKKRDGWVYGPVKDAEKKTHPCMVPFDELPGEQKAKDYLFKGVVRALINAHVPTVFDELGSGAMLSGEMFFECNVKADKTLRVELDGSLQKLKGLPGSRERSLAITKLQEGIMWLGMDLKRLNGPNPYPDSYDPGNTRIAPTADNLKL